VVVGVIIEDRDIPTAKVVPPRSNRVLKPR
jgi:hypothetical protein